MTSGVLSSFDRAHIRDIIDGGMGDWFSADLLRLMKKADAENFAKLASLYPDHAQALAEHWTSGG